LISSFLPLLKKKSPFPGTCISISYYIYTIIPLLSAKIKVEVKIRGKKTVQNIHFIYLLVHKSNLIFIKTKQFTEKSAGTLNI